MKKTYDDLIARAKQAIENEEPFVTYVAIDYGQMADNVGRMAWFVKAVARQLVKDVKAYSHLTVE